MLKKEERKKCVIFLRGGVKKNRIKFICNAAERSGKYQIAYFVDDPIDHHFDANEIQVITSEELLQRDTRKQMQVIVDGSEDGDPFQWALHLGYPTENITLAEDIIKEAANQEYQLFLEKYEHVEENVPIRIHATEIIDGLKKAGFEVVNYRIDQDDYREYLERIDYEKNYPSYLNEFGEHLPSKTVQHYVSYQLLHMNSGAVYVDIASSNSVFSDIAERLCHVKAYKQDIGYQWGIHGNRIGSFASSVPMPDHSVDYMALHCSLEHFEGNEDFKFFQEAYRLMPVGGKVCIIPLYLADEYIIQTSPSVWLYKYTVYDKAPELDPRAKISINDSICQRQSKFLSVDILKEELLEKYSDKFRIQIYYIENCREVKGANPFALLLEKK